MKSHTLTVHGALLSINTERRTHPMARASAVKQWRTDAAWSARAARLPSLGRVSIVAQPYQHSSVLGDAGNHLPSIKAVIDGLVDVGVLTGDGPDCVASLTMMAPKRTKSKVDHVDLELVEVAACGF